MEKILGLGLSHHIMREKEILVALKKHPNVIELLATAKDEENLYFIFEMSPNGTVH